MRREKYLKNLKRVIRSEMPKEHTELLVLRIMTIISYYIEWKKWKVKFVKILVKGRLNWSIEL